MYIINNNNIIFLNSGPNWNKWIQLIIEIIWNAEGKHKKKKQTKKLENKKMNYEKRVLLIYLYNIQTDLKFYVLSYIISL